ncbi:MAG: hydrogenase formation protein HypD [Bdellovibrio sp.]
MKSQKVPGAFKDQLKQLAENVSGIPEVRIMEFCGGHTHALVQSGLLGLLPSNIKMIHGPGCPVCVLPAHHIDAVIDLMKRDSHVSVACFGDLMRIPTMKGESLAKMREQGHDVRLVYNPSDLITFAKLEPQKSFLYLAIGFETTAPATARLIEKVNDQKIDNIKVYCLHVTTDVAIDQVMKNISPARRPMGLIGPGHVSMVTGLDIYHEAMDVHRVPICISGFEPEDLLESLVILTEQIKNKEIKVTNQYTRALKSEGNQEAQKLLARIFERRDHFVWRGLGSLPASGLKLKSEFQHLDAEKVFTLNYREVPEHPACLCSKILIGEAAPTDCKLYHKACTPNNPMGSCMVSSEGACSAYYAQGIQA